MVMPGLHPHMERYGGGPIVIRDHDPAWAAMFEDEERRLRGVLGPMVVGVEHMGSTAVPGLPAKPIIDLLVGVRSLTETRSSCVEPLAAIGYAYLPEYESFLPDEISGPGALTGTLSFVRSLT